MTTRRAAAFRHESRRPSRPQLVLPLSVDTPGPLSHTTPAPSGRPVLPLAPLAAIAAGIPTPVDEYGPVRAYCEGGYGVVFGRDGGRVNEPAGPVFPSPRRAVALANLLNGRLTT